VKCEMESSGSEYGPVKGFYSRDPRALRKAGDSGSGTAMYVRCNMATNCDFVHSLLNDDSDNAASSFL
jgi:hypothetical protein